MATSWTDISGLINFQKAFIQDISNNAINVTDVRTQISGINSNLAALQVNLSATGASLLPVLTYQADISNILQTEKQRLDNKKAQIDTAYAGQKRMVALNDSLAARKKAYNYMLLVVVFVLFAYMGLIKIKQFVPEGLGGGIDILIIAIFVAGFVYCFNLFLDISRRNNMDYNQIDLAEPKKKSEKEIQDDKENARKSGRLTDYAETNKHMVTDCAEGSTFNTQYQICLPKVPLDTTFIYNKLPSQATAAEDKRVYSSLTAAEKTATSIRIFKSDNEGFYWGNSVALCGSDANYNTLTLKCKGAEGFCGGNIVQIKPYDPLQDKQFGQYIVG